MTDPNKPHAFKAAVGTQYGTECEICGKSLFGCRAANSAAMDAAACTDTGPDASSEPVNPQQNAALREALKAADTAINPPDRTGISLHVWNERLKAVTKIIRAALEASK